MKTATAVLLCAFLAAEASGQVPATRGQVTGATGSRLAGQNAEAGSVASAPAAVPKRQVRRSLGKKLLFTTLGAAGGFAAGLYIGLRYFDEALYSDRKVWTCIAIGTAAGAVAGWALAPDRAAAPAWTPREMLDPSAAPLDIPVRGPADDDRLLLSRVRAVNHQDH